MESESLPIYRSGSDWLRAALREEGTFEWASGSNPRVEKYHETSGGVAKDDIPWCASFVNWCLEQAGYKGTGSKRARSFLDFGAPVFVEQLGAIVVLSRGNNPNLGHVGFFLTGTRDTVVLLGGNQGNAVSTKPYPRARVLQMRWPRIKL